MGNDKEKTSYVADQRQVTKDLGARIPVRQKVGSIPLLVAVAK